ELPAAQRPAALRARSIQAVEALPARRDGADDDPLADGVDVFESGPELFDDPHRLVTEDQPGLHGILAADDVHVRAADRGGRDPNPRCAGARPRPRHLFDREAVFSFEYDSLHRGHGNTPRRYRSTFRAAGIRAGIRARTSHAAEFRHQRFTRAQPAASAAASR